MVLCLPWCGGSCCAFPLHVGFSRLYAGGQEVSQPVRWQFEVLPSSRNKLSNLHGFLIVHPFGKRKSHHIAESIRIKKEAFQNSWKVTSQIITHSIFQEVCCSDLRISYLLCVDYLLMKRTVSEAFWKCMIHFIFIFIFLIIECNIECIII